jgi:hypothetical protein
MALQTASTVAQSIRAFQSVIAPVETDFMYLQPPQITTTTTTTTSFFDNITNVKKNLETIPFIVPNPYALKHLAYLSDSLGDFYEAVINREFDIAQTKRLYNTLSEVLKNKYNDDSLHKYDDFPMYKENPVYAIRVIYKVLAFHDARPERVSIAPLNEIVVAAFKDKKKHDRYREWE